MPQLVFGSFGPVELLIILSIVVVLFGATRMAGIGKGIGRSVREFRREVKENQEEESGDKEPVRPESRTEEEDGPQSSS